MPGSKQPQQNQPPGRCTAAAPKCQSAASAAAPPIASAAHKRVAPPPEAAPALPPVTRRGRSSSSSVGHDADGTRYCSAEELWDKERKRGLQQNWYGGAIAYWSSVPATVDAVLGGFGNVSPADLGDSARFLDALADAGYNTRQKLRKGHAASSSRAVDCGAGVGRITAGLLVERFTHVDVVEPVAHLLQQARAALAPTGHRGEFYEQGLEVFTAAPGSYDCIWIQVGAAAGCVSEPSCDVCCSGPSCSSSTTTWSRFFRCARITCACCSC